MQLFASSNTLTRREIVMTFALLSLYLEGQFDEHLYSLNARQQKLISVYKSKKSEDLNTRFQLAREISSFTSSQ